MRQLPPYTVIAILALAAAASSQSAPPLTVQLVASGLNQPVGFAAAPNDPTRLFIVEHGGAIRIIKNGVLLSAPFLDLTDKVEFNGEDGLNGLAFHPNYAQNGQFFVSYDRKPDMAEVIERYQVSAGDPDAAEPASVQPFITITKVTDGHNGGMLAFSPIDGMLYISIGDGGGGGDPLNNAHNPSNFQGKMLRINVDVPADGNAYSSPPDNKYPGPHNGLDEIYAIGLRNPWRFSFDRETGNLYLADVGQETSEEIDFLFGGLPGGADFGWRCMEGFYCTTFSGGDDCVCNDPNLTYPIHTYDHPFGECVIGGYVYRGASIPEYDGHYFFSDFPTTQSWSFKYDGFVRTDYTDHTNELAPPFGSYSIVSYGEDATGEVYFVYMSGEVGRIMPASLQLPGISNFGPGSPGCTGAHDLRAATPAKVGMNNFYMTATNAPANSLGLGLATSLPGLGYDDFGLGLHILVDLFNSSEVIVFDMPTDENGMGYSVFNIPNNSALAGSTYYLQSIFYWPSPCAATNTGFSASDGMAVTIQP
ncbi:MAG: PQQ-dependent sugar dehydrogenase [Planctomycetes bacterium]|nr:PQQ-dependent sugar dehydrogenase [Planctomycetota bacterium]